MLLRVGKLSKDQEIGAVLTGAGRIVLVGSILAGAWILRIMATTVGPSAREASAGATPPR